MRAIDRLDELTDRYDAILCDVWGVIHNGRRVFADAAAALQRARRRGLLVVLLTNAPKPRDPLPGQLDRLGFPRDAWDEVVTSGDAIRDELRRRAPGKLFKIGPASDAVLWDGLGLERAPLDDADFFGVSGLEALEHTPATYAEVLQRARARDLELLCANPDVQVRYGEQLIWCAGALARDYQALGGRVVMAGKPFAPIYALAHREIAARLGRAVEPARVLCIGDGIGTDVAGANRQAHDCLFVATGMHGERFAAQGAPAMDAIAAELAANGVHAEFVIDALR
ncbi:MAG: TIGR01459 family HAD-type hydrolase [Planctomycetes bacterium]|nr:TIGR01459 family HAD-type hydrolase [Planctomycetota bacterium]